MGKARSKAEEGKNVLCIQCHGDGSLIGQGHNHEILNMQSIPGYTVNGSLHFCCDNNVAFTASGAISRSAARPGDCALPYGTPVVSVSASSPAHVIQGFRKYFIIFFKIIKVDNCLLESCLLPIFDLCCL